MKLSEAIAKCDRSRDDDPEIDHFTKALRIEHYFGWSPEFNARVRRNFIERWLCTDTMVGTAVYFFDDKPVAVSWQSARKNDTELQFFSKEDAVAVREFLYSLVHKDEPQQFASMDDEFEPIGRERHLYPAYFLVK